MLEYKCIKKLVIDELDEFDGVPTGNEFIVEVESVWIDEEDEFSGHLSNYDGSWLQIDSETLEEHFEKI